MQSNTKAGMLLQQAIEHHRSGNYRRASALYRKCLKRHPENPDALHFLGMLESQLGNHTRSAELIAKAVDLMVQHGIPGANYANAINNLGNALNSCGEPEKALDAYKRALELRPGDKTIINNIGNALKSQGKLQQAIACFNKAIDIDPRYIDAYINIGNALREQGSLSEATASYNKAIALNPGCPGAHSNLAIALLSGGNFRSGWREYEWRWQAYQWKPRPYRFPVWKGESLDTKTILVYAEQGIGDEIMFSSCYANLSSTANNVIVECDPRLEALFNRSFDRVISKSTSRTQTQTDWLSELPDIDVQIAAGSLPMHLRRTLDAFPAHAGYLKPDPGLVNTWRQRYAETGNDCKVGISWRGGTSAGDKKARSLKLEQWQEILTTPCVTFVNLQYGDCRMEIDTVEKRFGVTLHDWADSDPLRDMDSFAAQIKALDLVISVDNSTVHMAGSLGVETWVLQPFAGDWRWLRGNSESYWYPDIRHFWQAQPGDWGGVIHTISTRLGGQCNNR